MDTRDAVERIAYRMGNQKSKDFLGITIGVRPSKPWRRRRAKIGRNELCPCGSGKKFKKCCIGK